MSIQTRLRETSDVGGGGGGGVDSAGLATNAAVYILSNANANLANAMVLLPGSSVTTHISGTNLYINATTSLLAASAGLAGKDAVYVLSTFNAEYTNAVYIRPGSSVTTHITGSTLFINATTGGGSSSGNNSVQLLPQQAKLYASNSAARIDAGTAWWRLLFSSTTQQYGVWQLMIPGDYGSNPFIRLAWALGSTITVVKSCTWTAEQFAIPHDLQLVTQASYLYQDTFAGANSVTIGLSAGYSSGTVQMTTIPLATITSFGAGNLTHIRISNTGDFVGDLVLAGCTLDYTRS